MMVRVFIFGVMFAAGHVLAAAAQDCNVFPYDAPVRSSNRSDVSMEHLELEVDVAPQSGLVRGRARIYLEEGRPDSVTIIAPASRIDSVFAGTIGAQRIPAPFRQKSGDTTIVSLHSFWESVPNDDGLRIEVVYRNAASFEFGEDAVWTIDPLLSGGWFPHAPGSFTSDITISVPSGWTAVTAGEPAAQRKASDGREIYLYRSSIPLPARSILLAAGLFGRHSEAVNAGGRRVEVTTLRSPESEAVAAGSAFAALFDELGIAYPLHRYTEVVLPAGDSVIGAGLALVGPGRAAGYEQVRRAFSAASWEDLWLEEALPAYLQARQEHSLLLALRDRYLAEAEEYVRPLVWNRWNHPTQLLDAHTRAKGPWVLHVISRRIGDDALGEVIERLLIPDEFAQVSTTDFYEAVRAATNEDYERFLDAWIRSAEHPVLTVAYRRDGDQLVLDVRQEQHGELIPEAYALDLTVEVGTLAGSERFDVRIDERDQEILLPTAAVPRFIVVDPDADYLLETRVDQPVSAWVAQLRHASTPMARVQAARALRGDSGDPALMIAFRSALEQEEDPMVRTAILRKLSEFPHSEAAERAITGAFGDEAPSVRIAVLEALRTYRTPQAEALALRAAQSDPDHDVQAAAVHTLGSIEAASAVGVARAALITPSRGDVIRQAGLVVLGWRGQAPEVLQAGQEYSGESYSAATRRAAVQLLSSLAAQNRNAKARLVDLLHAGPADLRIAAAEVLVGLNARSEVEDHLAEEPIPYVRHRLKSLLHCR